MGITILNAAMTTTLSTMRSVGMPGTLTITYASTKPSHPGMTYVENGSALVALLRKNGVSGEPELRVQWAVSPEAPFAVVSDVRNAMMLAGLSGVSGFGGQHRQRAEMGAQAYTTGNDISFGAQSHQGLLSHELVHLVHQSQGKVGKL
ncbi:MAG: eCIS core domain-containing protein [Paracoccaceae bacterium]